MNNKKIKYNTGFSLIETVFYIAIFIMLSTVTINAMIILTKSFRSTKVNLELMQSGNILERVSREIKQATSIHTISTNSLKLNTLDDAGNPKTITFTLSSGNLAFYENDVLTGNLNGNNIYLNNLTFTQVTTTESQAVKVYMQTKSNHYNSTVVADYYNTLVLRGDY